MTEPHRTMNFDTSGTVAPQPTTNGLRLTDIVAPATAKVATPATPPARAHVPVIKSTNPAGVKYK